MSQSIGTIVYVTVDGYYSLCHSRGIPSLTALKRDKQNNLIKEEPLRSLWEFAYGTTVQYAIDSSPTASLRDKNCVLLSRAVMPSFFRRFSIGR